MLKGLREKFWKWKEAFDCKDFKVDFGKTKMVVSGTEGEMVESRVDRCGVCEKRTMANLMWCTKCELMLDAHG